MKETPPSPEPIVVQPEHSPAASRQADLPSPNISDTGLALAGSAPGGATLVSGPAQETDAWWGHPIGGTPHADTTRP